MRLQQLLALALLVSLLDFGRLVKYVLQTNLLLLCIQVILPLPLLLRWPITGDVSISDDHVLFLDLDGSVVVRIIRK